MSISDFGKKKPGETKFGVHGRIVYLVDIDLRDFQVGTHKLSYTFFCVVIRFILAFTNTKKFHVTSSTFQFYV